MVQVILAAFGCQAPLRLLRYQVLRLCFRRDILATYLSMGALGDGAEMVSGSGAGWCFVKTITVISYRHFFSVSFLGIILGPSFSFLEKGLGVYRVLYESHYSGSWERRGLVFCQNHVLVFLISIYFWIRSLGITLEYLFCISLFDIFFGYLFWISHPWKGHGLMFCHNHVLLLLLSFNSPITPSLHTFRLWVAVPQLREDDFDFDWAKFFRFSLKFHCSSGWLDDWK